MHACKFWCTQYTVQYTLIFCGYLAKSHNQTWNIFRKGIDYSLEVGHLYIDAKFVEISMFLYNVYWCDQDHQYLEFSHNQHPSIKWQIVALSHNGLSSNFAFRWKLSFTKWGITYMHVFHRFAMHFFQVHVHACTHFGDLSSFYRKSVHAFRCCEHVALTSIEDARAMIPYLYKTARRIPPAEALQTLNLSVMWSVHTCT